MPGQTLECLREGGHGIVMTTLAQPNCPEGVPRVRATLTCVHLSIVFERQLPRELLQRLVFPAIGSEHETVQQMQPHGVESSARTLCVLSCTPRPQFRGGGV